VSVIERTREFGVMTALGLNQMQIARMVTLEAVYTTSIGFVVGALCGYGLTWLFSTFNIMGPLIRNFYGRVMQGVAISDEFIFAAQLGYLAWAATTIVIAALLAIVVPGRRVRNLNPSEAMRSA
jgi:putative ABC transport system permease protein